MLLPLSQAKAVSTHTAAPFTLSYGNGCSVKCLEILRFLPDKRLVCRGEWNNHDVIVKIFFNSRHFNCEISALGKLAITQLPCAKVLTQHADVSANAFLLITSYLPNKGDLKSLWATAYSDQQRFDLLKSATELVANMHLANCYQKDIHWENFLLSESDEINIIDAGQILFKPLTPDEQLTNLALFFAQMEPAYDGLIPQSLIAYQELHPTHSISIKALDKTIKSQRAYRIKKYALKCLRNATQFSVQQQWNQFFVIDRGFSPVSHFNESTLNTLIKNGRLLKDGNSATVAQVLYKGNPLTIKRYNIKNIVHFFKRCFKPSRARRSWQNGHILQLLGINTAKPIALLENRIWPIQLTSYLVTEYLEGTLLKDYIKTLENENKAMPDWLNHQITQMLTGLWRAGISHGDFKATNFLVVNEKLILIDLDSMQVHTQENALQDAIKKDIKRFLKNWGGDTQLHFRKLLKGIKISVFTCSSGV